MRTKSAIVAALLVGGAAFFAAGCGSDTVSAPYAGLGGGAGGDVGPLYSDVGPVDSGAAADSAGAADASAPVDAGPGADTGGGLDDGAKTDAGGCAGGCDDGLPCTKDLCKNGYCIVEPIDGFCITGGKCWPAGPVPVKAGDPQACRVCDPKTAVFALSKADAAPCDDGNNCTIDDTCEKGDCVGTPGPGCCHADADCKPPTACQLGICDVDKGSCSFIPKPGCCTAGLCCDLGTQLPKPAGTPCTSFPLKNEWGCDGDKIRRRQAKPGCDGNTTTACSTDLTHATWDAWTTVETCPAGKVCAPIVDPNKKPECGDPGACTTDAGCNDGKACTIDTCKAGKCSHATAPAGTVCAATKDTAEYRCNPAKAGEVQARYATATCDGGATCPKPSGKTFSKWVLFHDCKSGSCEDDGKATTIPQCGAPAQCKAGTKCCGQDGKWAPKATKCGETASKKEFRCVGTAGGVIEKREAFPGCSGNSSFCSASFSQYLAWGPWTKVEQCKSDFKCELGYSATSAKCTDAKQCQPGTTCCDAKGFFAATGSKCGTSAYKTEYKCEKPGTKASAWLKREGFKGCTGKSTWCSSLSDNLYWGPWAKDGGCKATDACKDPSWSGSKPTCTNATTCYPSSTCCGKDGEYEKQGTKCSTSVWETEYRCDGAKAGKVQKRRGYRGCTGKSTSCSYADENLAWDPWTTIKTCKATELCVPSKYGSPSCSNATQCKAGTTCCTGDGLYAPKASKCGATAVDTKTRCTKDGKAIEERKAYPGCSGGGTTCYQYTTSYYAWSPWTKKYTCSGTSKCKESFSGAKCQGGSTECTPGYTCCTPAGKWATQGSKCGNYASKTEYKCTTTGKGGQVLRRRGYGGCTGKSSSCSSAAANLAWSQWETYDTCEKYEQCTVSSYSGTCKNVSKCSPSQSCCTADGEYEKAGSKCGSWPTKTEYKCSSAAKGGDVMKKELFTGCSGTSGYSCSSKTEHLWSEGWKLDKDCPTTQYCYVTKYSHYCTSTKPN